MTEVIKVRVEADDKASKKLFDIKKAVGAAFGAATIGIIARFTMKLTELASIAEETANKFKVVFKGVENATKTINELSKQTGFGVVTLKKMTSSLGDLIKPTGIAAEKAFDLSEKIVKLSLDLASFNKRKPAEVIEDFMSALAGAPRPLTKYGINVKESSIAQEAFNLGLTKSIKEYSKLDPLLKDQVRIQAIVSQSYKQSTDAIGDLSRTSENYSNRSNVLNEKLTDTGELVGNLLIPAFNGVKGILIDVTDELNTFLKTLTGDEGIKDAKQQQIDFLNEFIVGFKEQQRLQIDLKTLGDDYFKTQAKTYKVQSDASKVLLDNKKINEDLSKLGNEQVININDLFDSEVRAKNILEEQLGIRELTIQNIEKAIQKLQEQKKIEKKTNETGSTKSELERQEKIRQDNLDKMLRFKEKREEILIETYIRKEEIRQSNLDKMLQSQEDTLLREIELYEQQEKAKEQLLKQEKAIAEARLQVTADLFAGLSDLTRTWFAESETAFEFSKALAIVETTISTYAAAQKAFESLAGIPIVGPGLGAIAAAAAVASGLARVSEIKSQEFQAPGKQFGGDVQQNSPVTVGERGRELFVPNSDGFIVNNRLLSRLGNNQTIVINAIDSQSFTQFMRRTGNSVLERESRMRKLVL